MSAAVHAAGVAGDPASPVHRLDPRTKLIGLGGVTAVAVSASEPEVLATCAAALTAVAAVARIAPRTLARRARVVLPLLLVAAACVPFARGGLAAGATVAAKAAIGTFSAVLLGATTPFGDILHALERLRAPRVLTLIAAVMHRYLFVVAGEARRMRTALAARGYRPRHAAHAGAVGRVVAALFLRSYERGERVHLAMLARGYAGPLPQLRTLALQRADVMFLAALAVALLPLRVIA